MNAEIRELIKKLELTESKKNQSVNNITNMLSRTLLTKTLPKNGNEHSVHTLTQELRTMFNLPTATVLAEMIVEQLKEDAEKKKAKPLGRPRESPKAKELRQQAIRIMKNLNKVNAELHNRRKKRR